MLNGANNKEVTAKSSAVGSSSPNNIPVAVNALDCVRVLPNIFPCRGAANFKPGTAYAAYSLAAVLPPSLNPSSTKISHHSDQLFTSPLLRASVYTP